MVMNIGNYLSQISNITPEQIMGGSDISLSTLKGPALVILIVLAVVGILWCFFGLKLVRVWSAILGFVLGTGSGAWITATQFDLDATIAMIISLVAGIVVACLGAILYRVGIFLVAWITVFSLASSVLRAEDLKMMLIALGIGFVVALLTVAFAEPITMVVTGLYGAVILGTLASQFIPIDAAWVQTAVTVVFAVLGIWVQFLMESGKRKKRSLKKAAEIREQNSTANEVEKARAMMENLDSIPEDEAGRKVSHAYEEYEEDSQFDDEYDIDEDDDITYIE